MSNPVLLESRSHGSLRVRDAVGEKESHTRNTAVIADELQRVCASYPVFLVKNPSTGQFSLVALFGFDESENLFCKDGQWSAPYVPLNTKRGPFMLGSHASEEGEEESVMLVDMDDRRVQVEEGEPLFNERGFPTPYLEKRISILKTLKDGFAKNQSFIAALLAEDMIVPATFKIEFADGEKRQIDGLYTINQDAVRALSDETVCAFHQNNYFEYIYMIIASLGQMQPLIDRKNQTYR